MAEGAGRVWELRYGQCWEDADRLVEAFPPLAGRSVLSIASGGDNSLALLAEGPGRLVAVDRNPVQIAALELKAAAVARLEHGELMVLLGAWDRPGGPEPADGPCAGGAARVPPSLARQRLALYDRCRDRLSAPAAAFWDRQPQRLTVGLLHAGRFERYLARFRRWILPLLRDPAGWQPLLEGLSAGERARWYVDQWDGWRWQLLFRLYFSRLALGRLGTDPAQVRYGEGCQGGQLLDRLQHALTALDPAENPYLHWILRGRYGRLLPRALRPEQVERIRLHLDRLELHVLALEDLPNGPASAAGPFDGFNLSNVFEYLTPEATTEVLGRLHRCAAPGARLVCWNRLADRDCRLAPLGSWEPCVHLAQALHQRDRVFFYRRLVVADAIMAGDSAVQDAGHGRCDRQGARAA